MVNHLMGHHKAPGPQVAYPWSDLRGAGLLSFLPSFQTTTMSRLDIDHQYKALVSRSEKLLTAMQNKRKEEEERERLRRIQEEMDKERQRREQEEQQRQQEETNRRL